MEKKDLETKPTDQMDYVLNGLDPKRKPHFLVYKMSFDDIAKGYKKAKKAVSKFFNKIFG